MNIFKEADYRKIIRSCLEERRKAGTEMTFQALAEQAQIQKSYLSKVMKGDAELNQDQLFLICEHLHFSEEEKSYVSYLLEFSRCGVHTRKKWLQQKIDSMREEFRDSQKHLQAAPLQASSEDVYRYYLDPLNQLVRIGLTIEKFRKNPDLLASELYLAESALKQALKTLEDIGLIARRAGEIEVRDAHLHLSKDSPAYQPWIRQKRVQALQRLHTNSRPEDYHFSVVFSGTDKTRRFLQESFLELLKASEDRVKNDPAQGLYQMSFDLFSWA